MFVYTMKASGVKFFVIIALSVAVLTAAISILPSVSAASDVASVNTDFKSIATEEDMVRFLSEFGHEVEPKATNIYEIEIPEDILAIYDEKGKTYFADDYEFYAGFGQKK